jgi:hypothetical protein
MHAVVLTMLKGDWELNRTLYVSQTRNLMFNNNNIINYYI